MAAHSVSQTALAAGPVLRTIWLIGLPLAAALWAAAQDRRLMAAALFGGAAAALLPAAMLETALPIVITHNPGGGGGMIAFFWHGVGHLALALLAAVAAWGLWRQAQAGPALPQGGLGLLFAGFYAAMIVPRHTPLTDALLPSVAGPSDPLAPLTAIAGIAPSIAAVCLAATGAVLLAARRSS